MRRVWELWDCLVYKSKAKYNLMSGYCIHFSQNNLKLSCLEREFKTDKRKYCLFTVQTLTLKYSVVLILFSVVFQRFFALFNSYIL